MFRKLAGLTAIAGLFFAGSASAGIDGSAHDFVGLGWNSTGEICAVCHAAHNATQQAADQPLWDHDVTAASFAPYASDTMTASVDNAVGGASKLCLSCHDGTVALDSFGGAVGGTTITGAALVGTSGADDHPVGFLYDDTLATTDGGLWAPTTTTSGLGGNIDDDMLFGLGLDQVECGSCHDVHDDAVVPKLLRKSNADSALCLTCHNK